MPRGGPDGRMGGAAGGVYRGGSYCRPGGADGGAAAGGPDGGT